MSQILVCAEKLQFLLNPNFYQVQITNHKLQINLTPQASSLATPPVQNMIWVNMVMFMFMMMLIQMATCAKHPRKNGGQTKQGFLANLLRHYRHLFHWHWHLSLSCYIVQLTEDHSGQGVKLKSPCSDFRDEIKVN